MTPFTTWKMRLSYICSLRNMNTTHSLRPFRLLDLPPELRQEIYRHALSVDMERCIASFERPIAVPEFYAWVDKRLVSAAKFIELERYLPDFRAFPLTGLVRRSDMLYVDTLEPNWISLAKRLGMP